MQAISRLESLSNAVWRADLFGQPVVRKRYSRRGRKNGYRLPRGRILVEILLLDWLSRLAMAEREYLVIPEVLSFNADESLLCMTNLGGIPLGQFPTAVWPVPQTFAALGRTCALLERSSDDIMRGVPRDVWTAQGSMRREVVDRRIRNVTSEQAHLLAGFAHELSRSLLCESSSLRR